MAKSTNHMFAYSFFFSLYQLLDIFHRRLLLLQWWMAVVRSTLCLDVHQPQSFINDERRKKRISFFFLSQTRKERERTVAGEYFYSLLDLSYVVHNNLLTFPQYRPQTTQNWTFSFLCFVSSPCKPYLPSSTYLTGVWRRLALTENKKKQKNKRKNEKKWRRLGRQFGLLWLVYIDAQQE